MDSLDAVALTRALIDIDSTTGREDAVVEWMQARLELLGFRVERQVVEGGRANLFACDEPPTVVFSTHLDCVPPHIPSHERDGLIFGRGACDAKGVAAAQLVAVERLRREGCRRVGLLFVVGEERGSDGARAAAEWTAARTSCFLVNGEPTGNRLALGTLGILRVRIRAVGRAAHSSFSELGDSAIEKLMSALVALRGLPLPVDPVLGKTIYTVGLIAGGVAPNVVPANAEAEVLFRTVGDPAPVRALLATLPDVAVDDVIEVPVTRFEALDGFETDTFPYTTDAPFLNAWGRLLLVGPGDPRVAHTDAEHVPGIELTRAVDMYVALARQLVQRAS